jgi:CRISPR-associated endonuclease/helicase Cas3
MVTEMAPADLLLQRAGRLQRHQRERPEKLKTPEIWICQPDIKEKSPNFGGGTEAVYDYHVLLRSWLAIKNRSSILIPGEVEELIEKVYDDKRICPDEETKEIKSAWEESLKNLKNKRGDYEGKAKTNRILPPTYNLKDFFEVFNKDLEEDNPLVHETLQALTRYSEEPTISIICLYGTQKKPYFDAKGQESVDTLTKPDTTTVKKLLTHSVSISNRILVRQLFKDKDNHLVPEAWRQVSLLRHHFILIFNETGRCDEYGLRLDKELGLVMLDKTNT